MADRPALTVLFFAAFLASTPVSIASAEQTIRVCIGEDQANGCLVSKDAIVPAPIVRANINNEAQVDAFIEKILSFRDYIFEVSEAQRALQREDAILGAVNDLVGRLQRNQSPEALKQPVGLSD